MKYGNRFGSCVSFSHPVGVRIFFLLCVFSLFGCEPNGADTPKSSVDIVFGETRLTIPKNHVLPDLHSLLPADDRLDTDDGINITVPLSELGIAPKGTGGMEGKIIVFMHELSEFASKNKVLGGAPDAWNANGLFKERIIEFDGEVNLYRVYAKTGYPVFWEYFKSRPAGNGDMSISWVASCRASLGQGSKADLSRTVCHSLSIYKSVESQISFSGSNINELSVILDAFQKMVERWDRS